MNQKVQMQIPQTHRTYYNVRQRTSQTGLRRKREGERELEPSATRNWNKFGQFMPTWDLPTESRSHRPNDRNGTVVEGVTDEAGIQYWVLGIEPWGNQQLENFTNSVKGRIPSNAHHYHLDVMQYRPGRRSDLNHLYDGRRGIHHYHFSLLKVQFLKTQFCTFSLRSPSENYPERHWAHDNEDDGDDDAEEPTRSLPWLMRQWRVTLNITVNW